MKSRKIIEEVRKDYDDDPGRAKHKLAWDWWSTLNFEQKEQVTEDVERSVFIWINRFGETWQKELEEYVSERLRPDENFLQELEENSD